MERAVWVGDGGGDGLRHTSPSDARRLRARGGARGSIRAYLSFGCEDGKACSELALQSSSCSPICCGEFFYRTNGQRVCSRIRDIPTGSRSPKSSLAILGAMEPAGSNLIFQVFPDYSFNLLVAALMSIVLSAIGSSRFFIPPVADTVMCTLHAGILIAHQIVSSCGEFRFQCTFISV